MRFRIWIEQQGEEAQPSMATASKKNELVKQLLGNIQDLVAGSAGGEGNLRNSLSKSFSDLKNGDDPGANVIRRAFQPDVYQLMDAIGLEEPKEEGEEGGSKPSRPASTSVEEWLSSDPTSATVGDLLNKIFGADKIDDVLNKGELPSGQEQEGETAEGSPEQQAIDQQQIPQGVDTQPQSPPIDPQTGMPMAPNTAPVPPQPGGPPANLPPAPMGAGKGF